MPSQVDDTQADELARSVSNLHQASALRSWRDNREKQADYYVVLGQKQKKTVRGRSVEECQVDLSPPLPPPEAKFEAERRLQAARDRKTRREAEREAKTVQFLEQRIAFRMQALEITDVAEVEFQKAQDRRDQEKLAREEALKKTLSVGWQKRLALERLQAEEQQLKKEEKAQEEQRKKRYYEKQKQRIEQWYLETDSFESDPHERARRRREEQEERAEQARRRLMERLEPPPPPEQLPLRRREVALKRREAVNRAQMVQECSEERPPLSPRAHDVPKPMLQILDDAAGNVSGAVTQRTTASKPGSWVRQAKVLSLSYGLSSNDTSDIEHQLRRTTRGIGRLSRYDDSRNGCDSDLDSTWRVL